MSYKTALIFGGSGFIGRTIVQRLATQQYNIRVACRDIQKAQFLKSMGEVGQIVPVHCNITSVTNMQSLMQGADIVINMVGIIAENRLQTFNRVHRDGPQIIAQAASMCAVKQLIHISAMGANVTSASVYARSKAEGEQLIKQHFPNATIIRPSLVFGPHDHFFNLFANMARLSPALPLVGSGTTHFQPIYVDDIASSILHIIDNDHCQGEIYELGGPDILSFRELLKLMITILNRRKILIPIPFGLAKFMARFMQLLPNPLLTVDQVTQLKCDNLPSPGALTIDKLGIVPQSLRSVLPSYLKLYMKNY